MGSHVLPQRNLKPNDFIVGIECTSKVSMIASTNTTIKRAIVISERLKKLSILICPKDFLVFTEFIPSINLFYKITRGGFTAGNTKKIIYDKAQSAVFAIEIYFIIGFPL